MNLGLIGYPIQHSKSPWIHQQFLDQTNLMGSYDLIEIAPERFNDEIIKLKESHLNGFNVTIPYKERIIPYLDELSPEAERIGAVNTVICRDNKWFGHNTDGIGLVTALKSNFPTLFSGEKSALILGAGGASRGIYFALSNEKLKNIAIANRTISRAEGLIKANNAEGKDYPISYQEAEANLAQFDLIIQTTSVGMSPNSGEQIIDLSHMKKGTVISDIVYQPFWTSILKDAEKRGGLVHHGHEMLIYQAKHAFEKWTERTVNVESVLTDFLHTIDTK